MLYFGCWSLGVVCCLWLDVIYYVFGVVVLFCLVLFVWRRYAWCFDCCCWSDVVRCVLFVAYGALFVVRGFLCVVCCVLIWPCVACSFDVCIGLYVGCVLCGVCCVLFVVCRRVLLVV